MLQTQWFIHRPIIYWEAEGQNEIVATFSSVLALLTWVLSREGRKKGRERDRGMKGQMGGRGTPRQRAFSAPSLGGDVCRCLP